ncbi:DUF1345 domain-containing protein [Candidatus Methylocalor cossyra]|uniref:DUF1345 domain-containing protein n=1 Tax=Candidatus Methylocalor cossyra TaxID=3108543 RepID=A0ABP1C9B2_9GAMM
MGGLIRSLNRTTSRRLAGSAAAGVVLLFASPFPVLVETRLLAAWDVFTVTFLVFTYARILRASPDTTGRDAKNQDQSGPVILMLVVVAASTSLFAIGFMLGHREGLPLEARALFLLLATVAVAGSWLMTHTMFALHYAHRYYGDRYEPFGVVDEGLAFPGGDPPDYMDFVYFAFVIGMTAQVSDVAVTSRAMRHLVWLHSLLSFAFYTGILALAINVLADLL